MMYEIELELLKTSADQYMGTVYIWSPNDDYPKRNRRIIYRRSMERSQYEWRVRQQMEEHRDELATLLANLNKPFITKEVNE